jgi:NADPH-dependent 2,4-dienoyl-CoA reductase/sulfur reductase-like enzyme
MSATIDVDVLVIGAGPAGLNAALDLRRHGLSVLVADENPQAGGQFLRAAGNSPLDDAQVHALFGADYAAGKDLIAAFAASGAVFLPRTRVWQIGAEEEHASDGDRAAPAPGSSQGSPFARLAFLAGPPGAASPGAVRARFVVLAGGAMERPYPLPGWTTPGAMSVGGAQILLKGSGLLPPRDAVLIGSGPLVYQFSWQVIAAGGTLQAIVETHGARSPRRLLAALPAALAAPAPLWRGARWLMALRRRGVRFIRHAGAIRLLGDERIVGASLIADGHQRTLATSCVLLHAGLIGETRLAAALGAEIVWSVAQQDWQPRRDIWQQSSLPGVFIAGDGGGIVGAGAASISGRLAALEITRQAGRISAVQRDELAGPLLRTWRRALAVRPFLDALYPPPRDCFAPADDAVVCRCEGVTAAQIRAAAHLGADGPNQIKAYTRAGMGPCQGRQCACITAALAAAVGARDIAQIEPLRARFPVKPVTLGEVADSV